MICRETIFHQVLSEKRDKMVKMIYREMVSPLRIDIPQLQRLKSALIFLSI